MNAVPVSHLEYTPDSASEPVPVQLTPESKLNPLSQAVRCTCNGGYVA